MINGAHTIIYAADADKARAFFRDVLGLPFVDVGHGWLIFGLPPAELAAHPAEGRSPEESETPGRHQLFLMCDDLRKTIDELKRKGAEFTGGISEQPWGSLTTLKIPGGGDIGLYQPRHARPPNPGQPPRSLHPHDPCAAPLHRSHS